MYVLKVKHNKDITALSTIVALHMFYFNPPYNILAEPLWECVPFAPIFPKITSNTFELW